jgi:capsular polysaccharide biosynthesis protein
MAKKIDIMEIGLSISRIFRLGFHNYRVIVFYSLFGFLLALGFTFSPFMDHPTYISKGSIEHPLTNILEIKETIIEAVNSTEFAENVASKLQEEVFLPNETFITSKMILDGLNAISVSDSLRINIIFSYPDESLSLILANKIIDEFIIYSNSNLITLNNNVILGEYATEALFYGTSPIFYLAIGALLGLMVGVSVGVLLKALRGTIYSVQDLKEFEISSFYLQMKLKSQLNLDRFLNLFGFGNKINFEREHTKNILQGLVASFSFTTIQNNLESTRKKPEEPLTTLMVTPVPDSSLTMVAFAYARQSSTQGRKTILIDFDLKDVPFTKYLETYQIETKKKASSKEGVTFLTVEENLDLYLPLQDIIPAKIIRDEETQDIINQIKKKYDHIIILGPSLLPDSSNISILNYVNSALIMAKTSKSTTIEVIKSVNLLIDNQLTAIETLVVEEKVMTEFPSLSVIQSWFKSKPKPITIIKPKPTKKK